MPTKSTFPLLPLITLFIMQQYDLASNGNDCEILYSRNVDFKHTLVHLVLCVWKSFHSFSEKQRKKIKVGWEMDILMPSYMYNYICKYIHKYVFEWMRQSQRHQLTMMIFFILLIFFIYPFLFEFSDDENWFVQKVNVNCSVWRRRSSSNAARKLCNMMTFTLDVLVYLYIALSLFFFSQSQKTQSTKKNIMMLSYDAQNDSNPFTKKNKKSDESLWQKWTIICVITFDVWIRKERVIFEFRRDLTV